MIISAELEIISQLLENVTILLALTFIYARLQWYVHKQPEVVQIVLNGCLFGTFATLVMLTPIKLAPGVFLDGRTMIIAVAAAFYGGRTSAVMLAVALPARFILGGVGLPSGLGMMLTSVVIGMLFYHRKRPYTPGDLLVLGILTAVQRSVWMLVLPADIALQSIVASVVPVLIVYPIGTVILGELLNRELKQQKIDATLRVSDLAFQTSLDGILITDAAGRITSSNPASLNIFGYSSHEQLIGRSYTSLLAGSPAMLGEDSTQHTLDYNALHASGKTFPVTLTIAPARDENTFLGLVITVHDMTEPRHKEKLLVETSQMLAKFANSLKQIHHVNTQGYADLSELFAACLNIGSQILGMSTGIVSQIEADIFRIMAVKSDIKDFAPGAEIDLANTYCMVMPNRKQTTIYEAVGSIPEMQTHPAYRRYGLEAYICAPLWVNGSLYGTLSFTGRQPRQFAQHEIEILELLASSINHALTRHATEEARRESEERYRSIVKVLSNGILLRYADGTIRASNRSAERIMGMTVEQMMGKIAVDPDWHSIHEDGQPFPTSEYPTTLTLTTGEPQNDVVMGIHKPTGELTWVSINTQPMIRAGENRPYAVAASFDDITTLKQMEVKLKERIDQLQMLHQAEARLTDQLNVEHVLRTGLKMACQMSGTEHGFIGLLKDQVLQPVETSGAYSGVSLTPAFIARLLELNWEGVLLTDAACRPLLETSGTRAQLVLPLVSHHELIGLLNLETDQAEHFTPTVFETLKLIAARLGVALQNAGFYYTTQQQLAELQALHQQVAYQAEHDVLTGLINRQALERQYTTLAALAESDGQRLAVLYIDLDRFKAINDTFGHEVGDIFLRRVATRLNQSIDVQGIPARIGGDEFAALVRHPQSDEEVAALADKILQTLQTPFLIHGNKFTASASIGISFYPEHGIDLTTLLRNADHALYKSKHQGRNTYQFYQGDAAASPRYSLEAALHDALNKDELWLAYQPQADLRDGRIVGVEALIRWKNADRGIVAPTEWINIAEESGLIIPIGAWILETACQQGRQWHEMGFKDLRVAVNISVVQFKRDDFIPMVETGLARSGFPPESLELEITESMLLDATSQTLEKLRRLKQLGINLSIDDFGTGYSSLSYLQNLPIDKLKIDRSFIQPIESESVETSSHIITRAVVGLAHNLGMAVVAEGVETEVQQAFLRRLGCDILQGYLLSAPVPPERISDMLLAKTPAH